jgi:hypothetical protein
VDLSEIWIPSNRRVVASKCLFIITDWTEAIGSMQVSSFHLQQLWCAAKSESACTVV